MELINSMMTDLNKGNLDNIISLIKQDYLYVGEEYPLNKYEKKIWTKDFVNVNYLAKLQSLTPIYYLLMYYHQHQDDLVIDKALQIYYLWYEECFKEEKKRQFDYTAPKRLVAICDLLNIVKGLDYCVLDETFEEVISSHIKVLNVKRAGHSTSSIDNDIAIIIAATTYHHFYDEKNLTNEFNMAEKRLIKHLDELIGEDSSYLDPGIQNAYYLLLKLRDLGHFLKEQVGEQELYEYILIKIKHLLIFLYAFIDPNGYLVPIGNSIPIRIDYEELAKIATPLKKHLAYVTSKGETGKPLLYQNAFFPKGNQFVGVTKETFDHDFIKWYFYASFHSLHHKHNDDLAFMLYYKNIPLFLDCGMYDENDLNFYQQGAMSCYSHNTICVDAHDYLAEENIKKTGITNILVEDDLVYLLGQSCAYENVLIKRNLLLIKNKTFIIIDDIYSQTKHQYEIIFNLNRELNLKKNKSDYLGYFNEEHIFSLKTLFSNIPLKKKYYYDNKREYKGIVNKKLHETEPCHTLIFAGEGARAIIIHQIDFGNDNLNIHCKVFENKIKLEIDGIYFEITSNKHQNSIAKNGELLKDYYNENKTLTKAIDHFYSYYFRDHKMYH